MCSIEVVSFGYARWTSTPFRECMLSTRVDTEKLYIFISFCGDVDQIILIKFDGLRLADRLKYTVS